MKKICFLLIICTLLLSGCENDNYVNMTMLDNQETGAVMPETDTKEKKDSIYDSDILIKNGVADKKDMILYKNGKEIKIGMKRKQIEKIVGIPINDGFITISADRENYARCEYQYPDNICVIYEGEYHEQKMRDERVFAVVAESPSVCDAEGFTVGDTVNEISSYLLNKYGEDYVSVTLNKGEYRLRWAENGKLKTKEDYSQRSCGSKTYCFNDGKNLSMLYIHALC